MIRFKHKTGEMVVDPWSAFPVNEHWLKFFLSKVDESPDQDTILNTVTDVLRKKEKVSQGSDLQLIRDNLELIRERYGGSYE